MRDFSPENYREVLDPTYLRIIVRTVLIATPVTVLCIVIAVPFALFMARVVPARVRGAAVAAVLVPLWASYLVKAYAWRAMVQPERRARLGLRHHPGLRARARWCSP